MQLESMYQEIILDHYRNPLHKGLREPYDAEAHHVNPVCGDEVTVRVVLRRPGVSEGGDGGDGGADAATVADVSYDGMGCSISQASASVMADLIIGKPLDDAMAIEGHFLELMQSRGKMEPDEDVLEDAAAFAGVSKYPARIKCALLAWMAWKDATFQAIGGGGGSDEPGGNRREEGAR